MTDVAALARCGGVNRYQDSRERRRSGRALNGVVVVAGRASDARDSGRLMVDKPARERRRGVTVTAVGSRKSGYMPGDLTDGTQAIVTGLTRDRVPRQYTVIEHIAHVVAGGVVADVARLSNVSRQRVRMRCRDFPGDRRAIRQRTLAIVAARLTASARYDDLCIGVIRERSPESRRRMTGTAFHGNTWMPGRAQIGSSANRDSAVVAGGAASRDTRVIEGSVRIELHETGGRVAVATFLCRSEVIRRLARGDDAIVTSAAVTEYFGVIDEARDVEAYR